MNKIIAAVVVVLGMGGLLVLKNITVEQSELHAISTSDANAMTENVRIGVDSWAGYYLLCSKHQRSSLRNKGIRSTCEDDNADLQSRFVKLRTGELDFAVTSVDAYLALGQDTQFPGTIIAVIDESKGGDAVVSWDDSATSIDDLKGNPELRVALTKDSPSEHLVRSLAVHFDVDTFKQRGNWLVNTDGAEQAYQQLINKQVDAAVLWEPYVTKALQTKGVNKIIGTEDTERLIVDVLLVNRKFANEKPEVVEAVLGDYFETLKFYKQNPQSLVKELVKHTGLKSGAVQSMLKGVKWATLTDNAYDWFSTVNQASSTEYLIDVIDSSLNILKDTGVLTANPIPDENPYLITQSTFIEKLYESKVGTLPVAHATDSSNSFPKLSEDEWENLKSVGTLKVRKIKFSRSSGQLSLEAKRMLDKAAQDLAHYPNFRILIKGHTGLNGTAAANKALSQDRADAVSRYLSITHGIAENRMFAQGVGSDEPLVRMPNESRRSFKYRLPRVELILKSGAI